MTARCERINTYEVLEHVMGIKGLHPHRLDTIRSMRLKLVQHVCDTESLSDGVVLDIGCGSGAGTAELAAMFANGQRVIGLDIHGPSIEDARNAYCEQPNLSFHHGDLNSFLDAHPDLKISAAISISVSMFIQNVPEYYRLVHGVLSDKGIFIDAPFMFRARDQAVSEEFRRLTYAVCGCSMQMFHLPQLRTLFQEAGFSRLTCTEHDFDLMKLPILFADYPARYLLGNFFRNVISPPACFGAISSRYVFFRTLKIFMFFLKHRHKYASGELISVKSSPN